VTASVDTVSPNYSLLHTLLELDKRSILQGDFEDIERIRFRQCRIILPAVLVENPLLRGSARPEPRGDFPSVTESSHEHPACCVYVPGLPCVLEHVNGDLVARIDLRLALSG
jgi:hypothetical protein